MAYVLSSSSNSPLVSPTEITGHQQESSCSAASVLSDCTVQHNRLRSISTTSLSSIGSYFTPPFRRQAAHGRESTDTPTRPASSINLNIGKTRSSHWDRRSASAANSRRASFASSALRGTRTTDSPFDLDNVHHALVGVAENEGTSYESPLVAPLPDSDDESDDDQFGSKFLLQQTNFGTAVVDHSPSSIHAESNKGPVFKRWVSKLKHKRHPQPQCTSPRKERWTLDDFDRKPATLPRSPPKQCYTSAHHKSDSQNSSMRFITSIRSATVTIASASIATVSRRTSKWRRGHQRSSILSGSEPRMSADSARSMMDEAARQRSKKRREKLEELIRTEESYVADVKALSNVRFSVLTVFLPALIIFD